MYAVIIKELRQIRHSGSSLTALIIAANALILPFISSQLDLSISFSNSFYYIALFIALLVINNDSVNRLRNEFGDPAFSPVTTTPLSAWTIAAGKMLVIVPFSLILIIVFKLIQFIHFCCKEKLPFTEELSIFCAVNCQGELWAVTAMIISSVMLLHGLSSLTSRHRARFDILFFLLAALPMIILFSMLNAAVGEYRIYTAIFAVYFSVAGFMLMLVGASPESSNRLLPFKSFTLFSVIGLPLLAANGVQNYLEILPIFMLFGGALFQSSALFERLWQSRRVMRLFKTPEGLLLFPVSTGALNSWITAILLFIGAALIGDVPLDFYTFYGIPFAITSLALGLGVLSALNMKKPLHPFVLSIIINLLISLFGNELFDTTMESSRLLLVFVIVSAIGVSPLIVNYIRRCR